MTDEKYQDEKNTDEDYQEKDILEDEAFKKSFADARAADKRRLTARASADKNNNKGTQTVKVSDFDMPFGAMVVFMVKWAIASIPAFFIIMLLFAIFGGFFVGIYSFFF